MNLNNLSINFHLWGNCNMACKGCFAKFQDVKQSVLPKGHLTKAETHKIMELLIEAAFKKITFVGGEPMLCPWLHDLIAQAKQGEIITMLVTNGSLLTKQFLCTVKNNLDWVAISIDSLNEQTNILTGRAIKNKTTLKLHFFQDTINCIKENKIKLKINTVVSKYNYKENLSDFISYAIPDRWKILQVLPIKGQNDNTIEELEITKEEFIYFINNNLSAKSITEMIPEDNELMTGSYLMLDPAGRFYDNTKGYLKYSDSILKVGITKALEQIEFDYEKYLQRGGDYNF